MQEIYRVRESYWVISCGGNPRVVWQYVPCPRCVSLLFDQARKQ